MKTILAVDDSATMREMVAFVLESAGYRVIEAEIRAKADIYGYSPDEIWAEVDLLRRTVLEIRRGASDGGRVA